MYYCSQTDPQQKNNTDNETNTNNFFSEATIFRFLVLFTILGPKIVLQFH